MTRNSMTMALVLLILISLFVSFISISEAGIEDRPASIDDSLNTSMTSRSAHKRVSECENMRENGRLIRPDDSQGWQSKCTCDGGENASFLCFASTTGAIGKSFDCKLIPYLRKFNLTDDFQIKQIRNFSNQEVPFVMYASTNHYEEWKTAATVIRTIFKNPIVFFDLGLDRKQIKDIRGIENVEYNVFNFSDYPDHVRNLTSYHFKGILLALAFVRFPVYWIIDASIRIHNPSGLYDFQQKTLKDNSSLVVCQGKSHSMLQAVHSGIFHYLPCNRKEALIDNIQSGIQFHIRGPLVREALKWMVLCSLEKECMAPKGHIQPCTRNLPVCVHMGCHRYDQSALHIIMAGLLPRYEGISWFRDNEMPFLKVFRVPKVNKFHV